jgi:serine/threonine-protein kinase RsbW
MCRSPGETTIGQLGARRLDLTARGYAADTVAKPVRVHWVVLFVLVAGGYVVGYKLAQNWFSAEDQGASFFPPAGVTLAALVLVPRRQWAFVLAAAALSELVLDLSGGTDVLGTLGLVLANVSEPLVGATLLTFFVPLVDLRRTRDLTAFLTFAVVTAPVVGAAIAATTFVYVLDGSDWWKFAFEWWSGDGLGVLVVGSAILSLRARPRLSRRRALQAAVLGSLAVAMTALVFEFGWFEFVYVPIALLVVMAFRVGTAGVALTGAIVAFIAASEAAEANEFWESVDVSAANRVLYLQLGLAVILGALLALAAEIAERERIAAELARMQTDRALAQERAELFDAERAARLRAEVLEHHAARLAAASTVRDVAATTIRDIEALGASGAWVQLVVGDSLELVEAVGVPLENLERYARYPLRNATPPAEAVRSARLVEVRTGAELDAEYPDAAIGRSVLGYESFVSVPLRSAQGRILGVLSFTAGEQRWLDTSRRQLLMGLAEQCGVALDRAQLQVEADRAAEDAALLARLGEVLERVTSTADRSRLLAETLADGLRAIAVVHGMDDDVVRLVRAAGPTELPELSEEESTRMAALALSTPGPHSSRIGELDVYSIGLRARGRALGALTLAARSDPRISAVLIERIGTRAALALDNALLYEQERSVSHSLQMSLLGGSPSSLPGGEVASAYLPGTAALEVGGDWYDVFDLPDGKRALVVGDVVGHGLDAAIAMGNLRGAVRALAVMGGGPRDLLDNLDLFVATLPQAEMATLAVVELDPLTGRMRYATAGHPPPIIASADGATRLLWEGRSAPLGSSMGRVRCEAEDELLVDDTLVLYTDGLVERRAEGIDKMLDRLVDVIGRSVGETPGRLVDAVLDGLLLDADHEDDVCILALRRVDLGLFATSFPASPGEIPALRQSLEAWLLQMGVELDRRRDLVLAVSEAAANAAEHAYGFDGVGMVRVEVRYDESGSLDATVADDGEWREPSGRQDRGRGTTIIRALMDDISIESGAAGTVVRMRLPAEAAGVGG